MYVLAPELGDMVRLNDWLIAEGIAGIPDAANCIWGAADTTDCPPLCESVCIEGDMGKIPPITRGTTGGPGCTTIPEPLGLICLCDISDVERICPTPPFGYLFCLKRRRRLISTQAQRIAAEKMATSPPITPPTIAPTGGFGDEELVKFDAPVKSAYPIFI